jgi:adenine-specific DNA-methyltransferase
MARKPKQKKIVETLTHDEAARNNIPAAEYQAVMDKQMQSQVKVTYPRGGGDGL